MLIEYCGPRDQFRRRQTYTPPLVEEKTVIDFAIDKDDCLVADVKHETIAQHLLSVPDYWEKGSAQAKARKEQLKKINELNRMQEQRDASMAQSTVMEIPPPALSQEQDFGKSYEPRRDATPAASPVVTGPVSTPAAGIDDDVHSAPAKPKSGKK